MSKYTHRKRASTQLVSHIYICFVSIFSFYNHCLLPELASPRLPIRNKVDDIREPQSVIDAINEIEAKKKDKLKQQEERKRKREERDRRNADKKKGKTSKVHLD